MKRTAAKLLEAVADRPLTVSALAEELDKSRSWISQLVGELEEQNLVETDDGVTLTDTYEARALRALMGEYDVERLLSGKREDVLRALYERPQTPAELETSGFASSTVYQVVNDLQAVGVVTRDDETYRITAEPLEEYLKATSSLGGDEYTTGTQRIAKTGDATDEGRPTAFSAFQRYGIEYYPAAHYRYYGEKPLDVEDVLIHAVRFAADQKQMGMCAVFYLHHRDILEQDRLWKLAKTWNCVERWADFLAYLDQREVHQPERFPPWEEFTDLAADYDVYPRGQHPSSSLDAGLQQVGEALSTETEVYLLGSANLVLRGLKDSTKDIDVVVTEGTVLTRLTQTLKELGYEERMDLERAYEKLNTSVILQRRGFPRWDIFVDVVANTLHFTEQMRERVDETKDFGNLTVHLLSPGDIFLFKSVTEREGDLEDAALLARQEVLDWNAMMDELERQEARTDEYLSFAVLDTLDILDARYDIRPPIHSKLVSHCLEHAILLTLDEPKTIRDLRDGLDFPDHRIYNVLRRLEEEGRITVDRSGTLNEYVRKE